MKKAHFIDILSHIQYYIITYTLFCQYPIYIFRYKGGVI